MTILAKRMAAVDKYPPFLLVVYEAAAHPGKWECFRMGRQGQDALEGFPKSGISYVNARSL